MKILIYYQNELFTEFANDKEKKDAFKKHICVV